MFNNYHIYEQGTHRCRIGAAGLDVGRPRPLPPSKSIGLARLRYQPSHSARIIVAQQQSLVVLTQGTDVQCYNYSLPYSFATVPSVAVCKTLIIQPSMTFKPGALLISSSPSSHSSPRASPTSPSPSGPSGSIPPGPRSAFHSWPKTGPTWKLDITRWTLEFWEGASLARTSRCCCPSDRSGAQMEELVTAFSSTAFKSAFRSTTPPLCRPSKSKSLTLQPTPPALSPSSRLPPSPKSTPFTSVIWLGPRLTSTWPLGATFTS